MDSTVTDIIPHSFMSPSQDKPFIYLMYRKLSSCVLAFHAICNSGLIKYMIISTLIIDLVH